MDLVTHGNKRREKEILWPSFLRERRWQIALVAMANFHPLERCWQTGWISSAECLQSCTVIISQWLAELIRAFMLISLAAVPKTGGGKYANLCRILMVCITSFNYHKIFAWCPFQDCVLFPSWLPRFPSDLWWQMLSLQFFVVLDEKFLGQVISLWEDM